MGNGVFVLILVAGTQCKIAVGFQRREESVPKIAHNPVLDITKRPSDVCAASLMYEGDDAQREVSQRAVRVTYEIMGSTEICAQ